MRALFGKPRLARHGVDDIAKIGRAMPASNSRRRRWAAMKVLPAPVARANSARLSRRALFVCDRDELRTCLG